MATVSDIVTRAYRKIGVAAEDEDLTTEQMTNGVAAYNDMTHAFKLRGVDLSHTDQVSTDTFSFGDEYREGFVYLLAERLSPDYVRPASFDADDWFRDFQSANTTISTVTLPTALTRMPSRYWRDTRVR